MCGIFGFARQRVERAQIDRAIAAMRHRGPDGSGMYVGPSGECGLGHARLSIIDLSGGAQPLFSEDDSIVLVCNGEIYDFERIREDLRARGHTFRTGSDSEVIIHLYEEYGPSLVEHLRGEFAFLLLDERRGRLMAVRDRFGIKPLFYHHASGKWLFGSEAKAIFATGLVAPKIDVHAVRDYLSGVIPDTIFEGIHAVPPASVLTVDLADGAHTVTRYWDLELPRNGAGAELAPSEHARAVREAFDEAVRLRLRADVPVGVYLSGGIDSAVVAATAARHYPGRLKAFSIAFPDDSAFNEIELARNMSAKIGAEFHSVVCDRETLLRNTEDNLWVTEQPFVNFHGVGKFLLSRLAREHVTVVLTGEGSDEVFLGYVYFQPGKGAMSDQINNGLRARKPPAGRRVRRLIKEVGFVPMPEHGEVFSELQQFFVRGIFARQHRSALKATHPIDRLKARIDRRQTDGNTHARQVQYFWIKSMLAPYLLCTLGDRAEMSHSIEGRTPFLDHHLFELSRTIPDEVKIYQGREKHVLREAFKDDLTEELYNRQKWPYSAPPLIVDYGVSSELDRLLDRYMSKEAIERAGIFNHGVIRRARLMARLLPLTSRLRRNTYSVLVLVLTVQILHALYVDNFDRTLESRSESAAAPLGCTS